MSRLPAAWVAAVAAGGLALIHPALCLPAALTPAQALDRYLATQNQEQSACPDSVFSVAIDASLPALKKQASMTGFEQIVQPGRIVYRGLRWTGDGFVKRQLIARYLAHETGSSKDPGDVGVTPANYIFGFDKVSDYNGLNAYVFQLKPRAKRVGLFRGELWLDADTAAPLRLWGDFVKSPSLFVRSFRFVQDYQTVSGCNEPLRLLLTARMRLAGTAEMTVWLHPASGEPEATVPMEALSDSKDRGQR